MNKKIKQKYRKILRGRIDKKNRSLLKNRDITIISANCVGGVIYHDLGLAFNSPTINLFFSASDYVKFVSNFKYYLQCELVETSSEFDYPCALCDDIVLHMVHYHSFEEGKMKWEERIGRINYNNLYFIMVDRDGCEEKDIVAFDNIPYKHKAFLTYKERPEIKCAVYVPESSDGEQIRDLCQYKSRFTGKRWLDQFDYVTFLNDK